jgi:hypothetical protein
VLISLCFSLPTAAAAAAATTVAAIVSSYLVRGDGKRNSRKKPANHTTDPWNKSCNKPGFNKRPVLDYKPGLNYNPGLNYKPRL